VTLSTDFTTSGNLPTHIEVPGYRLRRQVGSDGIGLWFDAEQESLGRKLTLKVLKPEYEQHEGARREFLAEMDRLSPLDHAGLTRVIDTIRDGLLVLVTERMGTNTLEALLEPRKPLGEAVSLACVRDVARALRYLEGEGLAHRNVSPRLISQRQSGDWRLATFRNVVTTGELASFQGKLFQDADYVAPEQVAGPHAVGPNTPTYQIAALLYHMLAGRPAHGPGVPKEVAMAHFKKGFPSLKSAQPFLKPAAIYPFVAACTQRDPSKRPGLERVIDALQTLQDGGDPGITPDAEAPRSGSKSITAPRPRRRRRRR